MQALSPSGGKEAVFSSRLLIVDDDACLRATLRHQLAVEGFNDVFEVGVVSDLDYVLSHANPDLILLDIQMPGMSGFELISKIQPEQMPSVVFATAFDSFAVDAFNVHALDYLLKPIDPRRLEQSLERVRKYRTRTREDEPALGEKGRLMTALSELPSAPRQIISRGPEFVEKKLAIRDGQQTLLIPYDDIDWIDAAGDYMCIHAQGATHIMRCTMKQLEAKLQDPRFARIHRSTLVNLTRILSVISLGKGESLLHLPNDVTLKVSRNFREALVDYLD